MKVSSGSSSQTEEGSWALNKKVGERLEGYAAAAAAKSLQSCPTLCDPIGGSPPGSPIPGILQARTLEWVAIAFSEIKTLQKNNKITGQYL